MSSLLIRTAKRTEAQQLSRIAYEAKSTWAYSETQMAAWADRLTFSPQKIESYIVRCAVVDNEIAGFYAMEPSSKQYDFEHLWVDPKYQGQGVGKQLFLHAINLVRERKGLIMTILSEPGAEKFYQKLGAKTLTILPTKIPGRNMPFMRVEIDKLGELEQMNA